MKLSSIRIGSRSIIKDVTFVLQANGIHNDPYWDSRRMITASGMKMMSQTGAKKLARCPSELLKPGRVLRACRRYVASNEERPRRVSGFK